jgi:site-specific recombinase XerD
MSKEEILKKLTKDLELRGRSEETVKLYVTKVSKYQDYYEKPADQMGESEIADFLHYLVKEKKISQGTVNVYNSALRFLYGVTLDYALNYKKLPRLKQNRKIPQIYTKDETLKIIEATDTLIHRAMLMLAYGSGLRVSEITNLKATDIESNQMRILVRNGKGERDRYAMLPQSTLETLRDYWRAYRPKEWLFEAPKAGGQYRVKTLQDAFKSALQKSGIKKPGTIHTMRHCFATHLYEDGHNLLALKKLMGHVRIDTTAWYTQLAYNDILALRSPLDNSLAEKYGNPRKVTVNSKNADA